MAVTDGLGDLYALLGVSPDASDDEIKRAYRARARELHPDTNHGDPDGRGALQGGHGRLRGPARPRAAGPLRPLRSRGRVRLPGRRHGRLRLRGRPGRHLRGLLRPDGRGRRAAVAGPRPAPDAEVRLTLEFAEAVFGSRKEITVRLPATCATCAGQGTAPGTEPVTCIDCQGTGELRRVRQSLLGQVVTSVACSRCSGTGEMIPNPCADCRGEGRRMEESNFTVEVPAGVEDGSTLRLAERGAAGQRGGPSGSLFVHLAVARDPRFERQGDHLNTTLTISVAQAALGHRDGGRDARRAAAR